MGTQSKNILRICSYDALCVCDALRDLKRRSNDRSKCRSNGRKAFLSIRLYGIQTDLMFNNSHDM